MAHEPTVSIRLARATVETAERAGVPRARFLQMAQFDAQRLEAAEGRLPRSAFYRLCELAIDLAEDPSLGLHDGEAMTGTSFNVLTPLMVHSASLRQALETLLQFHKLLSDQLRFQLIEGEDSATLRSASLEGASLRVRRFMAEVEMVGFFRMVRHFSAGARPQQVSFEYPAPAYRAEYTRIFEGAECFEQPFTGIVFDRALMNATSTHKDEELHGALLAQAAQRVSRLERSVSYTDRVRNFLLHQGAPTKTDMNTTARALDSSVRSLRRHLDAEGASYNAIANDAFATLAKRHLSVERRTIQETAYLMGYADSGAFHRAFKRCMGMTPSEFCARE